MKDIQKRIEDLDRLLENSLRACIFMGWEMGKKQCKTPKTYTCDTDKGEKYFLKISKQILELIKDYGESLIPKKKQSISEQIGKPFRSEYFSTPYIREGFNEAIDQMRAKLNGDIKSL